jgi:hypothetical protein
MHLCTFIKPLVTLIKPGPGPCDVITVWRVVGVGLQSVSTTETCDKGRTVSIIAAVVIVVVFSFTVHIVGLVIVVVFSFTVHIVGLVRQGRP